MGGRESQALKGKTIVEQEFFCLQSLRKTLIPTRAHCVGELGQNASPYYLGHRDT